MRVWCMQGGVDRLRVWCMQGGVDRAHRETKRMRARTVHKLRKGPRHTHTHTHAHTDTHTHTHTYTYTYTHMYVYRRNCVLHDNRIQLSIGFRIHIVCVLRQRKGRKYDQMVRARALSLSLSLALSLSLSLYIYIYGQVVRARTRVPQNNRKDREGERGGEREREREGAREGEGKGFPKQ